MTHPTPDQISQALQLPHTTGAARLRAEIIGTLVGLPVPDAPPAPQRHSHAPPLPEQGLSHKKRASGATNYSRLLARLQHGPIDMNRNEWRDVVKSVSTFNVVLHQVRREGHIVTLRNRIYTLEQS